MTTDKFAVLCEQVLIPRLGDLLHTQLAERDDMLDLMARELARIGKHIECIATQHKGRDANE
jgi:hypothetical protein